MKLYFDLMSPYAYLAAARAEAVLGRPPTFEPVLVGAIFALRGSGSWGRTDAREAGMAEIEQRAAQYGLPPVRWPDNWPGNSLHAMRVAVLAKQAGLAEDFAQAVFRRTFVDGVDSSDPAVADAEAARLGFDPTITQAVKDELRATTEAAYERGVIGVPCLEIDGVVHFGDDRLDHLAS
jgi:2-hydroxychromene-2-carboxylate isomerase